MSKKLIEYWQTGVDAAKGEMAVFNAMKNACIGDADAVIAVGKAAASMALGALRALETDVDTIDVDTLVITKFGHGLNALDEFAHVTLLEAAHPIPDESSINAGFALLNKVKSLGSDKKLIFLVSGGASALVEHLADGLTLFDLQSLNMRMMAEGLPIGEMNRQRRKLSQIKFGKLLSHFSGAKLDVFYISDVEGDALSVVGSGIGYYDEELHLFSAQKPVVETHIVASNHLARKTIEDKAIADGVKVVCNRECLYDDVYVLAETLSDEILAGASGMYIFGGEPTVVLPPLPGNGGRNQSLGLAMAKHIYGRDDIEIIVAGTDGSDGPTTEAGAVINGTTYKDAEAADAALKAANAGDYLAAHDALFSCGPTGTNVMDIVIAIKR